jgi:predicted nucleotide-binding protein
MGFASARTDLAQYRAVFQQRLDDMLRDVENGLVRGAGFARAEQVENKEDWVSAADALQLLKPIMKPYTAQMTICTRAHNGLIRTHAQRFMVDGRIIDNYEIPREFWWAEGHEALEQNWTTGDFETWIKRTTHLRAFGVSFLRVDIVKMIPPLKTGYSDTEPKSSERQPMAGHKVFLVHGHAPGAKHEVAPFLEKLGLEVIILHERPNKGRTLITKFEQEGAGVGFAVVLMTSDDVGRPRSASSSAENPRARQNVVFELGFFVGKIGGDKVCALIEPGVERPSDFEGIAYVSYGEHTQWRQELARELKAADVPFDSDRIIST